MRPTVYSIELTPETTKVIGKLFSDLLWRLLVAIPIYSIAIGIGIRLCCWMAGIDLDPATPETAEAP